MIKDLIKEGFILKEQGYYKKAIEFFYKAIEQDNTSLELLIEIAELYYLIHNEEKALGYIEKILDKNPTHIKSLELLKQIFIDKSAYSEAEQTAKNIYCITHKSKDLLEIFKLLNKQCKYDEIFEYKSIEYSDKMSYEYAYAYFNKQDYANAEQEILKYLNTYQNDHKGLLLLGKIYYTQNKKEKCVELLDQLNKEENKDSETLNFIGLIKTFQNKLKEAESYFLEAIKKNKESSYYYNLANVYLKEGELEIAKRYYNLAISLAPKNHNYHFALANLYYLQKHYKKALEELTEDFIEGNILKSIILYETGYLALAKQELTRLSKIQPDNEIIKEYQEKINMELGFI